MNGFSFVISKSCCLKYSSVTSNKINFCTSNNINFGTSSKIKFCTSNKIDLILCRLSIIHRQRISPSIANKPMLKHRVYSSSAGKEVKGLRPEASKVSGTVVLFGLLSLLGLALPKALEVLQSFLNNGGFGGVLKSNACCYIFFGVVTVFVAKCFLANIMCGFAVLHNKPFSIGDIIEVGHLKGQVIEMGLITTSLVTEESGGSIVPTSWINGQASAQNLVNKSRAPSRAIGYEISISIDKIEKVPEISEEIRNMMRSNSLIYLEQEQPFCYLSEWEPLCATLSFGCKLKQVSEQEFRCAEADILANLNNILKKHGATPTDSFKK